MKNFLFIKLLCDMINLSVGRGDDMKISTSILDCNNRVDGVLKLNQTKTSYIHIDVMDGQFVSKVEFQDISEVRQMNQLSKYPLDVHLMMENPSAYIEQLDSMNIEFVTVHLEIDKDKKEIFSQIRKMGYKVGVSIKPGTNIKELEPYLKEVDMVLVMSVEPGLGGQKFMMATIERIGELKNLIRKSGRNILIEVDGGINDETSTQLKDVDIAVVGSYIVKSDNYDEKVEKLLKVNALEKKGSVNLSSDDITKKKKLYKMLLGIGILPFILLLIWGLIMVILGA